MNTRRGHHAARRRQVKAAHGTPSCIRSGYVFRTRSAAWWRRYWSPKAVAQRKRAAVKAARQAKVSQRRWNTFVRQVQAYDRANGITWKSSYKWKPYCGYKPKTPAKPVLLPPSLPSGHRRGKTVRRPARPARARRPVKAARR